MWKKNTEIKRFQTKSLASSTPSAKKLKRFGDDPYLNQWGKEMSLLWYIEFVCGIVWVFLLYTHGWVFSTLLPC